MPGIRLPAFAKINLQLRILGKRADGYHELRTIFQSISLHDELELELTRSGKIEITVAGDENLASEPSQENLVYRALTVARSELNLKQGIRASLKKVTPVGRGLGGGSSDAAAALIGLQRLAKRELPVGRQIEIGASLGADVPFFLFGGTALGVGRGDEIYPLPDAKNFSLLVVSPGDIAVRTADAYGWLNAPQLGAPAKLTNPGTAPKLPSLCALCWSPQEISFSNDFEAEVFARRPRLEEIKRELLQQGAAEASLAGSGSAVFGRFQNPAQARRAARTFPQDQTFICETLSRGEYRRAQRGRAASGSRSRR